MELKQAQAEVLELAEKMAQVEVPDALDLSARLLASSVHLAEQPSSEEQDPEAVAVAYFDSELEQFPKGRAWWLPPRDCVINQAAMGYNLWRFTILPFYPKKRAYSEAQAGIVIHPIWVPVKNDHLIRTVDLDTAKQMVAVVRKAPTIQDTVRQELAWIEREFSIRIPEGIQSQILKDALPTARRRWSVDRLRVKDRLIPLDGSAPRDL